MIGIVPYFSKTETFMKQFHLHSVAKIENLRVEIESSLGPAAYRPSNCRSNQTWTVFDSDERARRWRAAGSSALPTTRATIRSHCSDRDAPGGARASRVAML